MMQRIEEPYDDHELELLRNIRELERMHREHMKPFYDALARNRELKPVRYVFDPTQLDAETLSAVSVKVGAMVNLSGSQP